MSDFLRHGECDYFVQVEEEQEREVAPRIQQEQQSQQLFESQQQQQKPVETQKTVSTKDDLLEHLKMMDSRPKDVACYRCLCFMCKCLD